MLEDDVATNKAIGDFGMKSIIQNNLECSNMNIITHCNTGSLATAGYGTALGVIRSLWNQKKIGLLSIFLNVVYISFLCFWVFLKN